MLTRSCAGMPLASWTARIGAAVTLSVLTWNASYAQGVHVMGCVSGWLSYTCVEQWGPGGDPSIRYVPQPLSKIEQTRAAERDRKWVAHCRPVIRHDQYGVARYQYAASGCEFGTAGK